MKIICIGYFEGFGGAERQLITLANQMSMRNHEVHLIVVASDKINYGIDARVILHSLMNVEHGNKFTRIFRRRKALVQLLNELKGDVVINFNFQSAYLLTIVKQKNIGKVLYSERADPGDKEYNGILGIVRSVVMHRIDGFVFQSDGAKNYFKDSHVLEKSIVVPNACFVKSVPYTGTRDNRIVTVGRLSKQKNQKLLIEAFALVKSKFPDYKLELYGDGELRAELEEYVEVLDLRDNVVFKGTTSNIPDAIKSAALFVLSSDYEGIPNALIEAMALGIPCISTDCKPGGARTLINNGENGLITPIGDSILLAKSIEKMLDNPLMAEKMGKKAVNISRILSPKNIYDKWETFFLKISNNQ